MKTLNEWDSKLRLGDQLPRPAEIQATSRAQAEQFAATLEGPIVAKASGVAHKTEGGLVRLGLTASDIGDAWDELAAAGDGTVLLAEQINAELELIVGGYRDAGFGPMVTIGIGGIAAEIFHDVVAMLAPPEEGELAEAVNQLKGKQLLQGIRGGPPVDLAALGSIVEAVSVLLNSDPAVVEIDCNPVMIQNGVPIVADALVVLNSVQDGP
jgi:acetyl-CoA synthetase (ADP-forming)